MQDQFTIIYAVYMHDQYAITGHTILRNISTALLDVHDEWHLLDIQLWFPR